MPPHEFAGRYHCLACMRTYHREYMRTWSAVPERQMDPWRSYPDAGWKERVQMIGRSWREIIAGFPPNVFGAIVGVILLLTPLSARALEIKLSWTDNSTNEDGFIIERRLDAEPWIEISKTAANVVAFSDPSAVAGRKHAYRVSAFNTAGKSAPSNEAASMYFAGYPANLRGTILPEQGVLVLTLALPKTATDSKLQMRVFDADQPAEGQLFINGNGPISLFPAPLAASNIETTVTIPVPISHWRDGENRLWFVHLSGVGYEIRSAQVLFTVPLLAPTGLVIKP